MKTLMQPARSRCFRMVAGRAARPSVWPTAWLVPLALCAGNAVCVPPHAGSACAPLTLRGHVGSGESYTHAISPDLDFKLEAVPAGWMVRVLPREGERPPHDYAELANPPYRSPTPLLVSTDFAFRAQDAIAWNPRTFRYFNKPGNLRIAEASYQALEKGAPASAAAAPLLAILPEAKEATLTILDAELSGGTADQTPAAASVAAHLAQTAHRTRSDVPSTSLGRLMGLTFQVVFPPPSCQASHLRR